jgi:uncharacterized protein YndB with AHSA1/START domain
MRPDDSAPLRFARPGWRFVRKTDAAACLPGQHAGMQYQLTIDIDASPERVWAILADLERWPTWTESISKVELIDDGPLREGQRARVSVRGAPAGTWTVATVTPGREFSWTFRAPGLRTRATHDIESVGNGSRVTLGVEQSGPATIVMRAWLNRVNRRNVAMEAAGLKRAAEGG